MSFRFSGPPVPSTWGEQFASLQRLMDPDARGGGGGVLSTMSGISLNALV